MVKAASKHKLKYEKLKASLGHPTRGATMSPSGPRANPRLPSELAETKRNEFYEPSSSAYSEHNVFVLKGDREVETLKGRKVNHLSPLTRHLNL